MHDAGSHLSVKDEERDIAMSLSARTIPAEEVFRLINPGIKGNLHDQAWDVADAVVDRMRKGSLP